MKKLMIAAAAAAMVGGVYAADATRDCANCNGYDTTEEFNAAHYNVTFKLKTLAPKKVTCGGCEGWCMEQGSRTIEGILWTCYLCDTDHPWQLALWEKKGSLQYTDDLVYAPLSQTGSTWQYTATYIVTGTIDSGAIYADQATAEVAAVAAGATADDVYQKAADQFRAYRVWKLQYNGTDVVPEQTTKQYTKATYSTLAEAQAATDWADDPTDSRTGYEYERVTAHLQREIEDNGATQPWGWTKAYIASPYSVTAKANVNTAEDAAAYAASTAAMNAVLAKFTGDTKAIAFKSVTDVKIVTAASHGECTWQATPSPIEWFRYSKAANKLEAFMEFSDNDNIELYAAGFGSFDAKKMRPTSISGYAVGKIDPTAVCGDVGNVLDLCTDFSCGDTCWDGTGDAAELDNTFFTGTWNVKYNAGLAKKTWEQIVPSFYNIKVDAACKE